MFRPKEKGELEIAVLGIKSNDSQGGDKGRPSKIEDIFNVTKTGPTENSIKITFEPKETLNAGDEIALNARLSSPSGDLESIFWVRVISPQPEGEKIKEDKKEDDIAPSMPVRVFQYAEKEGDKTWTDYGWGGDDIVRSLLIRLAKNRP